MTEPAQSRAERDLHSITSYLLGLRAEMTESFEEACERYADSVNAFFDEEAFSVSSGPRGSCRITCTCGWSLSLLLPGDRAPEAARAVLDQYLRKMVLHYEFRHNGLKRAGN